MTNILKFPAKPFPNREQHDLHDRLDAIYDVMKFPAVKQAMDELNTLRQRYDEVTEAIINTSQRIARVQKEAEDALRLLDDLKITEARNCLQKAIKWHNDEL